MPRLPRVVLPGYAHHVTQRGVRRGDVFFNDGDRALYLRHMSEQTEKFGVRILCYCLMTNHVHLIAVPDTAAGLARAVGEAHRRYTWQINRRLGATGYLFHEAKLKASDGKSSSIAVKSGKTASPCKSCNAVLKYLKIGFLPS